MAPICLALTGISEEAFVNIINTELIINTEQIVKCLKENTVSLNTDYQTSRRYDLLFCSTNMINDTRISGNTKLEETCVVYSYDWFFRKYI